MLDHLYRIPRDIHNGLLEDTLDSLMEVDFGPSINACPRIVEAFNDVGFGRLQEIDELEPDSLLPEVSS